jgi:hypothetical protein
MPTVNEANKKRKSYAWMISMIMEEKERQARERLNEINSREPELKKVWDEYQRLYDLHIKPLTAQVNEYHSNIHEKRKIEHFLQAQAEHLEKVELDAKRPPNQTPGQRSWTLPPQIEKLPYADKSQVGRKPKKEKALDESQANELMKQLKALDPNVFADLLKQVGGK